MISTTNVSNSTSTSVAVTQAAAIDSISGNVNVMRIASVGAVGVQPETGLVKVNITTGKEYLANTFACPPRNTEQDDGFEGQAVEICSLTENTHHKHEIKVQKSYQPADAPLTDNPIPFGAIRLFESSVYIDPLELLPNGYCSIEQTRSIFIQKDGPQCITRLDEKDQIAETCTVEAGLHVHTKKRLLSILKSASIIPKGALSFYQDYSYVLDKTSSFEFPSTFDPNDPPDEPGYSHKFVASKLLEGDDFFRDWQIPHGWDPLPRSVKEKYLNDIVACYKRGASSKAISERHGMNVRSMNGLLLLKLSRKEMRRAYAQKMFNIENTQNQISPFDGAYEFEETLGQLLGGRVRKRSLFSIQSQRYAVEKARKRQMQTASTAIVSSSTKGVTSSSEVVFSPPSEAPPSPPARMLAQDINVPPKKRLSFRLI